MPAGEGSLVSSSSMGSESWCPDSGNARRRTRGVHVQSEVPLAEPADDSPEGEVVDVAEGPLRHAVPEVRAPAPQDRIDAAQQVCERPMSCPVGELPHLTLDRGQRLLRRVGVDGPPIGPASPRSALNVPAEEVEPLVDVADARLLNRQAQTHRREHRCNLVKQRFRSVASASNHHDEIIGVADESHDGFAGAATFGAGPCRTERHPFPGEVLVQAGQRDVGEQRRENAALGCTGSRLAADALFREHSCLEKRLHQRQDPFVSDSVTHTIQKGRVIEPIEARLDVTFEYPLVVSRGRSKVVNLGDSVLGPASRSEAIAAWLEVRLENRLEHQLQRGLHDSVCGRRDAQRTDLAARLGIRLLPHPLRDEPAGLEVVSQPAEQSRSTDADGAGCHSVDAGGSCALVAPHPTPRHGEKRRVIYEVEHVIEATARLGLRPLVQLRLHREYPRLGLVQARPRCARIHRRPPRSALRLRSRWTPSPCGRLSRPRTTTGPPPHPASIDRRRAFPSVIFRRQRGDRRDGSHVHSPTVRRGRRPAMPLQHRHGYAADLHRDLPVGDILNGRVKTGHLWTPQNRPFPAARDWS